MYIFFVKLGSNSALDATSESIWLSFTSKAEGKADSLRIGINPEGAYNVQLVNDAGSVISQGFELDDVKCKRTSEACWACKVKS